MRFSTRLKRLLLTLLLIAGIAIAFGFAFFVVYIGSAIAFSGSTGAAHQSFFNNLAPFVGFATGAIALGGLVSLVNAVSTTEGAWSKSIALSALLGGLVSAFNPPVAKALLSLFLPVLSLVGSAVISK